MTRLVEADLTWTGERFEPGVQIAIGDDGRIEGTGSLGRQPTLRLVRRAVLPGFVNAHSHAFQRALRGRTERFPRGSGSFWTWRDTMYALADSLDPTRALAVYLQAFREMRDAGITTCGEFHYLHHAGLGIDYEYDAVVLEAARTAGIRLVLLNAFYTTGGIGRPLQGAQRRFASKDPGAYWRQMDHLARQCDPHLQTLGVVAHSVRAAPLDDISALHAEAQRRGLRFHMHVEEQRAEIDECMAKYGRRPMAVLNEILRIDGNLTAVHCTHTHPDDMARFLEAGGTVCVCPLTEGNLGDGLPTLDQVQAAGSALSLGSDSNARISALEEMRWLEYGQRLRREERGALRDAEGRVAPTLLGATTAGGAAALGLPAGRLEAGRWADLVAIDLDAPELTDLGPGELLEGLVFGAGNSVIWGTAVAGEWRQTGADGRGNP
jgi:formimidoylglutamate deiminase